MLSIHARDEIEILVTPEEAFRTVSDYEGIGFWLSEYSCKYLNGNSLAEGLEVYHQYVKPLFAMSKFTRVIDKNVPGLRLEAPYIDGDLRGTGIWSLLESERGAVVAYECDVTSQAWFPHVKSLLRKLKSHCEAR